MISLLAMVLVCVMLALPAYGADSATDTVTVNITVDTWIEIDTLDPDSMDVTINSSENSTAEIDITVLCNTGWRIGAYPNWGNYNGWAGFIGGTRTAPGRDPWAFVRGSTKTAADGDTVKLTLEMYPTSQDGELLDPDDSGSFTIDLLASIES